jgi:Type I restriction enzyme R protein N terminus (HSDR_N)
MFEGFDSSVFNDPEYKEDSVREDIIAPILSELGYRSSGEFRIIRSRSLVHPFVKIGSQKRAINIVPDYILEINGEIEVVIDAKSPKETLLNSSNAEQIYSYAIHPDVRAKTYSLCNGKEWVIWTINKFDPIAIIPIETLIRDSSVIEKYLSPKFVVNPKLREFHPDYGIRFVKMGFGKDVEQHFADIKIDNMAKIEDDLYHFGFSGLFGDESLMISFDFSKEVYLKFLQLLPDIAQKQIEFALSRQPYRIYDLELIPAVVIGKFGDLVQGQYEDFIPIIASKILLWNT